MSEGTEDEECRKSSKYKGFRKQGGRVRSQGRTSCSAVQQALISGASQDVSIQYIASYNVVFPLYVVVRGPAKHCVLYDMKRICSAYEAKFSQLGKLILQEIFSQETVSCFLYFKFPSCLCSKTMIVTRSSVQILLIASSSTFTSRWVYTLSVSVMAPEWPTIFLIMVGST